MPIAGWVSLTRLSPACLPACLCPERILQAKAHEQDVPQRRTLMGKVQQSTVFCNPDSQAAGISSSTAWGGGVVRNEWVRGRRSHDLKGHKQRFPVILNLHPWSVSIVRKNGIFIIIYMAIHKSIRMPWRQDLIFRGVSWRQGVRILL